MTDGFEHGNALFMKVRVHVVSVYMVIMMMSVPCPGITTSTMLPILVLLLIRQIHVHMNICVHIIDYTDIKDIDINTCHDRLRLRSNQTSRASVHWCSGPPRDPAFLRL